MNYKDTFEYIMKKFYRVYGEKSPTRLRFKRNNLGELFRELGYKVGAEIGVYTGTYSEVLCHGNPNMKLYCIDPWTTYDSEEIEPYAKNQDALNKFYSEAKKRLSKYNCTIIRKSSMDAVKDFKQGELDFVYIDANHSYQNVKEDVREWAKIVRDGGIVAGHDYGHFKHKDRNIGTKKAIDEYVKENNIGMLFLVNQNFQTTWFFVKNG